ncbi:MAG: transposase, partial [Oscillospiraceae bacterium]|nr:transposase [Oscillospiraceae bacterium]
MARMGRPPKADSGYHVSVHTANGYRYASTQRSVSNPDDGSKKYHHIHWGRLDENNRFIPGKAYILASPEERKKLIFPDDWDVSAVQQFSGSRKPGRPAYAGEDLNRFYGDIWLLEQLSSKLGIRKDLMVVFDGNEEMVNDILTLAYFPIITEYAYRRLPRWQRIVKTPSIHELTPSYVTRLTQSITEHHRKELLELRAARLDNKEILCVDSTSRSAWGDSLADIHWGKNKDHLPLPQTKEVVAYTVSSHMPVYYRTFPGNMPDSRSLPVIVADMEHAGFKDVIYVTDRGYESIRNLEAYILKEMPFIACSEAGRGFVLDQIKAFGEFNTRPDEMEVDPILQIYYKQYDYTYDVKSKGTSIKKGLLKVNLYLDPVRRGSELVYLDSEIKLQEEELKTFINERTACEDD